MNSEIADTAKLLQEISELRAEVERLTGVRDRLLLSSGAPPPDVLASAPASEYATDEDTDEARAFDAFYHAYDGVHAKTRKFLLG